LESFRVCKRLAEEEINIVSNGYGKKPSQQAYFEKCVPGDLRISERAVYYSAEIESLSLSRPGYCGDLSSDIFHFKFGLVFTALWHVGIWEQYDIYLRFSHCPSS
jgi:hypothetical protein